MASACLCPNKVAPLHRKLRSIFAASELLGPAPPRHCSSRCTIQRWAPEVLGVVGVKGGDGFHNLQILNVSQLALFLLFFFYFFKNPFWSSQSVCSPTATVGRWAAELSTSTNKSRSMAVPSGDWLPVTARLGRSLSSRIWQWTLWQPISMHVDLESTRYGVIMKKSWPSMIDHGS